mgnify:CR=1 FL=1
MGDVANVAGVSPATVARVLYNKGFVAQDKRDRVEAAVIKTGYRTNVFARNLRTQRSFTIGLVIVDGSINPVFTRLSTALEIEALQRGYTLLTLNHAMNARQEKNAVTRFIDHRVDAVICAYAVDPANLAMLAEAGIPVVQVERELTRDTSSVLPDSATGFGAAVAHLAGLGHVDIAYVGGDPARYPRARVRHETMEEERLRCFNEAMARHDLTVRPELVRLGLYFSTDGSPASTEGRNQTAALLALPRPPTAMILSSDILAAGALQAVYAAGMRVPDDISLIGFDDSISDLLSPPMTSIGRPMSEFARVAFDLALAHVDDAQLPPRTEILPMRLVERSSCGPVGNGPSWRQG